MKRRQLFEFVDQPWLPTMLRVQITDYTRAISQLTQPFAPGLPMLLEALNAAPQPDKIVDLCAGTGGPWAELSPQLNRIARRSVQICLTDRHPPPPTPAPAPGVVFHADPVDAQAVPEALSGVRTVFDGLHHFRPAQVQAILQAAVDDGQPIVVFEMLRRGWADLLLLLFTPLFVLLFSLRLPWNWQRMLLTWLIPLAPLVIWWDSMVSMLRCYRPAELLAMCGKVNGGQDWEWAAGSYRHWLVPVTWMIGYPGGSLKQNKGTTLCP